MFSANGPMRKDCAALDYAKVAIQRSEAGDIAPIRIVPADGPAKPAIIMSTVVLPELLGPSIVTNSPSGGDVDEHIVD
ncbi:hypothetical protein SAMN05216338_106610 [Bradyrhizobium sp. Rc2d]|uniref:hypothetical protein n=1 Tax=Bradyrhizobium sp. Rc2d TaxID=1855321 RepID=UPI000891F58F|nr:hypothetical protein [Bradyrhizobium sp. Rc2d]SDJ79464.1 hypothetical protein SAMN05216338_106610 [Bradyrhizobium sp. Rc2d]